jgi:hypothetical protein
MCGRVAVPILCEPEVGASSRSPADLQSNLPLTLNFPTCCERGLRTMMHDRIIQALGRVEIALGKLETKREVASVATDDPVLRRKHEQLRSETQAAIMQIDQILGKLEG